MLFYFLVIKLRGTHLFSFGHGKCRIDWFTIYVPEAKVLRGVVVFFGRLFTHLLSPRSQPFYSEALPQSLLGLFSTLRPHPSIYIHMLCIYICPMCGDISTRNSSSKILTSRLVGRYGARCPWRDRTRQHPWWGKARPLTKREAVCLGEHQLVALYTEEKALY